VKFSSPLDDASATEYLPQPPWTQRWPRSM